MRLGDRDREVIPLPGLPQQNLRTGRLRPGRSERVDIGVAPSVAPAPGPLGVLVNALVEVALARDVRVDSDDVRGARMVQEPGDLPLVDARPDEVLPQPMVPIHAP